MGCQCAKASQPSHDDGELNKGNSVFAQPPPILYHLSPSPPSRAVLMTARQIGLELEIREVDLLAGEHLSQSFLKINPEHCLPTLDDNGFILWESRAICSYLASRYGLDDAFYPKDEKARAVVDRRMYFDATTLYPSILNIALPIITGTDTSRVPDEKKKQVAAAVSTLDGILVDSPWVAGDHLTVADLNILSSITSLQALGFDVSHYGYVSDWLQRCEVYVKGAKENAEGCKIYGGLVTSRHEGQVPVFQ